jgi:hypothetical protein
MRAVLGIIVGITIWWGMFLVSSFLIVIIWPTTEEFRQALFEAGDYSVIPTTMLALFLVMYIPIGFVSGFVTTVIAKTRWQAWVVAAPIFAFAVFQHLFTLWDNLPAWYNVAVVLVIAPFTILGAGFRGPRTVGQR